jgi:hypothetical protein
MPTPSDLEAAMMGEAYVDLNKVRCFPPPLPHVQLDW